MNEIKTLLDDDREISEIHLEGKVIRTGGEVDKILSYGENGELAFIPWLAVYKNGEITERIPATNVLRVIYK